MADDLQGLAAQGGTYIPTPGEGTASSMPASRAEWQDRMVKSRLAGASWDDIHQAIGEARQDAIKAGHSPADVDGAMGYGTGEELRSQMELRAQQSAGQNPLGLEQVQNPWEGFTAGLKSSSGGIISGATPTAVMPEHAEFATHLAYEAGTMLGDIPAMVAGAITGGALGSLAGPGVGTAVVGGAAAFALPESIKQAYATSILNGDVHSPEEFASRQSAAWWNVAKQAVVGAWFGLGGVGAEAGSLALGASKGVAVAAKSSAELAAVVGVGSAMQGQLPSFEDITDAAILTATLHGVMKLNPSTIRTTSSNLMRNWVATGEKPVDAAQRAMNDPIFHQDMVLPKPSEPPPMSSETPTIEGNFVLSADTNPAYTGATDLSQFIHNRWVPMGQMGALPREAVLNNGQIIPAPGTVAGYLREFGEKAGFSFITTSSAETGLSPLKGSFYQGYPSGHSKYSFISVPDHPDAGTRWMGLGRYEVLYHEVGHALDQSLKIGGGSGDPNAAVARDPALQAEMEASSRRFRPDFWDSSNQNSPARTGYVLTPPELAADNVALWLSDPTARKDMPLFTAKYGHLLQPYADIAAKYLPVLRGNQWQAPPPGVGGGEPEGTPLGPRFGGGKSPPGSPPPPPGPGKIEGPPPEPEQPKIEMDPWLKADARWAPQEKGPGWAERLKSGLVSFYREMIAPDHPARQIQDQYENGGGVLQDYENPNFLRRLAENSFSRAATMIRQGMIRLDPRTGETNTVGPSLRSIFEPFDGETGPRSFKNYILARTTVDENKAALRDGRKPRDTGLDLKDALVIQREGGENAAYVQAADAVRDWRNGTLAYTIGNGTSKELYNLLTRDGFTHMPLYRREEIDIQHTKGEGPGKLGGTGAGKLKGSDLLIENPEVSLMKDAFRRVQTTDNNMANKALADIAEKLGVARKTRESRIDFTPDEMLQIGQRPTGLKDDADTAMREAVEKKLGWTFRSDEVPIWRDGKVEAWHFFDPAVTQFLKGLDRNTQATYEKVLGAIANVQRKGVVLNPLFPVHILSLDIPWQFITKPGYQNVIKQAYLGVGALFDKSSNTGHWQEWIRNGGADHVFTTVNTDQYIKDILTNKADPAYLGGVWNSVTHPLAALQAWGQNLSSVMKVGRYAMGRQAGESPQRAAAASTEAMLHRGGGYYTQGLNSLSPFFTAWTAEVEQTARAMFGIGRNIEGKDFNAGQFAIKAAALITIPMLTQWWLYKDEPWYKGAPEWQKNNGFFIHTGGYTQYVPLPPLASLIFGGIPRMMAERFFHDNPHAFDHMASSLGGALLPPIGGLLSSPITPIVEKLANYSFFRGRSLTPDSMKDELPPEQFTPYTTQTARNLSRYFSYIPLLKNVNLNPIQIDNFMQGWSGSLGLAAVKSAELAYAAAYPQGSTKPASHVSDWPLLSSWSSRYPSASNQPTNDFYQRMDLNKQYHGSLEAALSGRDLPRFQELVKENPASALLWRMGTKMPVPPDADTYLSSLKEARDGANIEALKGVLSAQKALGQLHTVIKLVGALPNSKPLTVQDQSALAQSMSALGYDNKPGMISANDKRQILDQAYTIMQRMSERGLKLMDDGGLK